MKLQWLIPILVPALIAVLKTLTPQLPKHWLPILAPVLGALLDLASTQSLGAGTAWGAALGSAGVGLREILDQIKKRMENDPRLFLFAWFACLAGTFCGCVNLSKSLDGRVVAVTQRTFGLQLGQQPSDQIPSFKLGLVTTTFRMIPTATNQLYSPPLSDSFSFTGSGLSYANDEDFSTLPTFQPVPAQLPTNAFVPGGALAIRSLESTVSTNSTGQVVATAKSASGATTGLQLGTSKRLADGTLVVCLPNGTCYEIPPAQWMPRGSAGASPYLNLSGTGTVAQRAAEARKRGK
jgi:hypothetical protein